MLKAFGDNILIRRAPVKEMTEGGLYIADSAKEKPAEGTILSVGKWTDDLVEGQNVVFGQYAGVEIAEKGEVLLLLRSKDILAIKEEDE